MDSGISPTNTAADLERLLDAYEQQGRLDGRIEVEHWAGGIAEIRAAMPFLRFGRRWFRSLWPIPVVFVGLLLSIADAQRLRVYGWMQSFLRDDPGTSGSYAPAAVPQRALST